MFALPTLLFLLLIFFLLSTQALIVTPRSCTACCKVWPPREAKKLHRVLVSSFREERRSSRSGPCSLAPRCPRTIKTIQTERRRGRSAYHILVALATIKNFIGKISRRTIICGLFFFSFLFFNFLIFFFFFFFCTHPGISLGKCPRRCLKCYGWSGSCR